MPMPLSKSLAFALLLSSLWLTAQAMQTTRTGPATQAAEPARVNTAQDELARHLSAAETYQLSGDLNGATVENRAIVAIALQRLGAIAIREGRFQRALQLLSDSLALNDDAEARTDLAIAHMRLLQIDQAMGAAQAALKLNDRSARAHHILGKLYYMKRDYTAARSELERAITLDPDLDAAYTLGMTYLWLKDTARAKLLFEEMQLALNNSAVAHILFGRAYEETGFSAEAEREFRQALAVDAKAPRAHFYLGYVILQHGGSERLQEARTEFERELQLYPQDVYANFFLGMLAAVDNDHPKAIRYLLETARLKPDFGEAYLYLGQSQAELGNADAEQSLRRAIELTPDVAQNSFQIKKAHFLLGRVLLKSGRRAESEKELTIARELQGQSLASSRQELDEILGRVITATSNTGASSQIAAAAPNRTTGAQQPEASGADVLLIEESPLAAQDAAKYAQIKNQLSIVLAQAYHNLGVVAAQQGQLASSVEQFAAAAQWQPNLAGLDRNWGIVSFRAAQYDKAIAPLARQVAAHPEDALARRMLGVSYYLTNNFRQAVETLEPLQPVITSDAEMAYAYGVSLVRLGDNKRALGLFASLARQDPRNTQARFYAAQGFMMVQDYERALAEFRGVARIAPQLPQAHYGAGQSLIRLNRLAEAEQEFRQELLLNPADELSKYHLAYVLLEQKQQPAEALKLLRETVAARPDYADAQYQLGKALVEQGDVQEAIAHLETAARAEPTKDYIHYQLSIAYRRAARTSEADRELQLYRELKATNRSRELPGSMGSKQDVP